MWKTRNPQGPHAPYCESHLPEVTVQPSARVKELFGKLDEATATVADAREGLLEALHRAHRDSDGGIAGNAFDGGRGPETKYDEHGVPVEVRDHQVGEVVAMRLSLPTSKPDVVAHHAKTVNVEIHRLLDAAHRLRAAVHALRALDKEKAAQLADQVHGTVQSCPNCGRLVAGTRDDRLISGRCAPGCYEYRRRTGKDRPREVWDKDASAVSAIEKPA